MTLFQGAIYRI